MDPAGIPPVFAISVKTIPGHLIGGDRAMLLNAVIVPIPRTPVRVGFRFRTKKTLFQKEDHFSALEKRI
jgi:hypothetical protein